MLSLGTKLADGTSFIVGLKNIVFEHLSEEDLFDIIRKIRFDETEESLGIKIIQYKLLDESFQEDIKKLSNNGIRALVLILNDNINHSALKDLPDSDIHILKNYSEAKEIELSFTQFLSHHMITKVSELLSQFKEAKTGEIEKLFLEISDLIKSLIRKGSFSTKDQAYVEFVSAASKTSAKSLLKSFVQESTVVDYLIPPEEKARIIKKDKIGIKELNLALLYELRSYLDGNEKRRLILESDLEPSVITALSYADKKIISRALENWGAGEDVYDAILSDYQPSQVEIELLLEKKNALPALLKIGIINKDSFSRELVVMNPEFFFNIPWVLSSPDRINIVLEEAENYDLENFAEEALVRGNKETEAILMKKLGKKTLCELYSKFSKESQVAVKSLIFKDLKNTESIWIIRYMADSLSEEEYAKTVKNYARTVDGADLILREFDRDDLRKLALSSLLASKTQREKIYSLPTEYNLNESEINRISDHIRDQELSSWTLSRVNPVIFIRDQKTFINELISLIIQNSRNEKISDEVIPLVNIEVFIEIIKSRGPIPVIRFSRALGDMRLAEIFQVADLDVSRYPELINFEDVLRRINLIEPLKGFELFDGKFNSVIEALSFLRERTHNEAFQEKAITYLCTHNASDFDGSELRNIWDNLKVESNGRSLFGGWAKGNIDFSISMIKDHYGPQVIVTEEDVKKMLILTSLNKDHWLERKTIFAACVNAPTFVLENLDLLSAGSVNREELFLMVANEHPEVISITKFRNELEFFKRDSSQKECLIKLLLMIGAPEEKVEIAMEIFGKNHMVFRAILHDESTKDYVIQNSQDLMKVTNFSVTDLIRNEEELSLLDALKISKEAIENLSNWGLTQIIKYCPNHKAMAQIAIIDRIMSTKEIFGDPDLINYIISKLQPDDIFKLINIKSILSLNELSKENREKITFSLQKVRENDLVKVKLSSKNGQISLLVSNNDALAERYDGPIMGRDDIQLSKMTSSLLNVSSSAKTIDANGIIEIQSGNPILIINVDDSEFEKVKIDVNQEINKFIKNKRSKKIGELGDSISKDRRWMVDISVTQNNSNLKNLVIKGINDGRNTINSVVKTSPIITKHQKAEWAIPGVKKQVLSPIMIGESGVGEIGAIIQRLQNEGLIESILLRIDMSDIKNGDNETLGAIVDSVNDVKTLIMDSGAFSGSEGIWESNLIEPNFFCRSGKDSLEVSLRGAFSSGNGVVKTLKSVISIVESMILTIAKKIKTDDAVMDAKSIIELSASFRSLQESELLLRSMALEKILFSRKS